MSTSMIAPTLVEAPSRAPLPFGVTSVVNVVTDSSHWPLGGVEAETLPCNLTLVEIPNECSTTPPTPGPPVVNAVLESQSDRTVYVSASGFTDSGRFDKSDTLVSAYGGVITGEPFVLMMYEGCQILGRMTTAERRLREAWDQAEPGGIDTAIEALLERESGEAAVASDCLAALVGDLEAQVAEAAKVQPTLFLPRKFGPAAFRDNLLVRVGDHLETQTGSPVALYGGSTTETVYATSAIDLRRGPLQITGPVPDLETNEYRLLGERTYLLLLDCIVFNGTVTDICASGAATP